MISNDNFFDVCLPRSLRRLPSGRWTILNSLHSPLGTPKILITSGLTAAEYEAALEAHSLEMPFLDDHRVIRKLDAYYGDPEQSFKASGECHLWHHTNHPNASPEDLDAYMARLRVLAEHS